MATLVTFHAHPDDEAIGTGGSIAKATSDGHRVVLVVATRGEHGEVPEHLEGPGEDLAKLRTEETLRAAEILGISRVEFLGYEDSGMAGDPLNDRPESFWQADVQEAAEKLAAILQEESAHVVTFYDENGVYGHPDHIQVHRVGMRAAEIAGTPHRYMSTVDNARSRAIFEEIKNADVSFSAAMEDGPVNLGVSPERITTRVNVEQFFHIKQAAMAAHESQIFENSFFLGLPHESLLKLWGLEHFIRVGAEPGFVSSDIMEGL